MKLEVPYLPFYSGNSFFRDLQIPLRVLHVENTRSYPEHRHEFNELILICGGSGIHIVNGKTCRLGKGDVFLIEKGSSHAYVDPVNLNLINILYDADILHDEAVQSYFYKALNSGIKLSIFAEKEAVEIINKMDQELLNKRTAYPFAVQACFIQLLCVLCRNSLDNTDTTALSLKEKVNHIAVFLKTENGPEISIADMAEEAGTSIRNFHRIFRQITGDTPSKYINRLRINKSCELLRSTDKTISQIASLVNFDDSNYFTRQFRSIKGCSPSDFRGSCGFQPGK